MTNLERVGGKRSWPEFTLYFLHMFGRTWENHQKKISHDSLLLRQRFEVKAFQMQMRASMIKEASGDIHKNNSEWRVNK